MVEWLKLRVQRLSKFLRRLGQHGWMHVKNVILFAILSVPGPFFLAMPNIQVEQPSSVGLYQKQDVEKTFKMNS